MLSKRAIAYGAASYALVAILALDEVQRGKDLYTIATNLSSNGWFLASACNAILIAIFTWAWCLVKALVGPIPAADWLRLRESIVPTIFNISMAFVFVNAYHMDFVRFLHVLLLFMFTFIRKLAEFRSENLQTQATTISNTVRFLCLTTVLFTSACGWSLVFLREPQSDTGFGAVLAVDYVSIAIYTVGITLRFLVDIYDKYRGGNWEAKAKVTYYVKIACEVATASAHVILLTLWFKPSALVYRAFFVHGYRLYGLIDNLRTYLKLTHLFETTPDATAEDLAHDAQCSICLDDMQPNQGCKRIPCGHCFHRGCLSRWVERNKTCPYCRQQINLNHAQARPPNPAPAAAGADGPAAPAAPAPPAARNAPGDPFQNAYQQYLDAHRQAMAQQGPRAAPAGAPVREVRLRETQVVTLTNRRVAFDDDEVVIEEEHEEDAAVLDADKARATIRAYKKFARSVQLAQIALERELAGLDGVAVETPDRD